MVTYERLGEGDMERVKSRVKVVKGKRPNMEGEG